MNSRSPARLSSSLLSRKGMAAPSAGPETRANMVGTHGGPDVETTRPQLRQGPAPARSTLADWLAPEPAPSSSTEGRYDRIGQKRVRVSLRLDAGRHARLKLVATQRNCTLQSLFTEAIDEFFVRHAPDLHGISEHLRRGTAAAASGEIVTPSKRESEDRNGPLQSR